MHISGEPCRSTQRPDIGRWTPDKIEHRFRASEDSSTNDMFFGNGVNVCAITTVCQFDIAEPILGITIVDQYVIRFDI